MLVCNTPCRPHICHTPACQHICPPVRLCKLFGVTKPFSNGSESKLSAFPDSHFRTRISRLACTRCHSCLHKHGLLPLPTISQKALSPRATCRFDQSRDIDWKSMKSVPKAFSTLPGAFVYVKVKSAHWAARHPLTPVSLPENLQQANITGRLSLFRSCLDW